MTARHPFHLPSPRRRQRGAALLLAMLIVTLVATLAAAMVWQQWRAIEVESAERARAQAVWLIEGATDWARLILRTDGQDKERPNVDSLNEPWNTPLQEVKLADFLAADKNNTEDTGLDVFLSGQISDAQARYNLRNLLQEDPQSQAVELATLRRLCELLGLPLDTAQRISEGMQGAELAEIQLGDEEPVASAAPLPPQRVEQLAWFGLDTETIQRLRPFVIILPEPTPVNLLTAPTEVLAAVLEGLDRGSAERFVQRRTSLDVKAMGDLKPLLPERVHRQLEGGGGGGAGGEDGGDGQAQTARVAIQSGYFEILGELRYQDFILREQSLVARRGLEVVMLRRQRLPAVQPLEPQLATAPGAS